MPYGTSTHQGRVRRATATYAAASQPVDAEAALNVISNNLDHYADSMAQHAMVWSVGKSGYASKSYLTPRTTGVVVDTWYQIAASGPFPIMLRADGSSYKMRVRLAGASSGGHAVKFGLVLAPVTAAQSIITDATSSPVVAATDSVFVTATTTSSTAAWLTGTSKGTAAYTTMVELTAEEAFPFIVMTDTPVDLSGARSSVAQCLVSAVIFGSTANTGSVPRFYGGIAQGWVG